MLLVVVCVLFAQAENNRLIVYPASGQPTPFVSSRIDSLVFTTVEGRVAADIIVHSAKTTELTVSFTRTPACDGFKFSIVPKLWNDGNLQNDASAASYIHSAEQQMYYENFDQGTLSGIELKPGVEYVLMTLGYDRLGTQCDVVRVPFTTPAVALSGNPQVKATIEEVKNHEFSITFEPNSDVDGYATVAGEKGTTLDMIRETAMMFGFSCVGDAIQKWGITETSKETKSWTDMEAGVDYEIFIQAWDKNGTYAEMQVVELKTKAYGTSETANVEITAGKYEYADWFGEMLPSQFIKFTPDENTNGYYIGVYVAEQYDQYTQAEIVDAILTNPTSKTFYGVLETDFQINPNTEFVALAIPKNADGEVGNIAVKRFTTPATVGGAAANVPAGKQKTIPQRKVEEKKMSFLRNSFSSPILTK